MNEPLHFYQNQIRKHTQALSAVKKRLFVSSMLRLMVFVGAVIGSYLVFWNAKAVVAIVLLAIALFLFLVSRHTDLERKRDTLKALLDSNENEIRMLNRDFYHRPEGNQFKDPTHYFSQDIDLFGRGSFYQYVNRTALQQGSETLAQLFLENSIEDILQKQEAVKALSKIPEWRQEFSAIASLTKAETGVDVIHQWLTHYTPFVPKAMRWLPWLFSGASLLFLTLYFLGILPGLVPFLWVFTGLGMSSIYTRKITKLGVNASKAHGTFTQYNQLIQLIENHEFEAQFLSEQRRSVMREGEKTSTLIQQFSRLLNGLDKNNNVFYLILANGYFLRALTYAYQTEQWIQTYGNSVEEWFDTIAFFDAYNSLGNFAFNHPNYQFPRLTDEKEVLKVKGAGHPLLDPKKNVLNDFQIDDQAFLIITGANMAGKSTFLRTVSLLILMGNIGLPVCADSAEYQPVKLITSMRTTDSLTDEESYFFSELKRLRFIVDEIQNDRYFIVLDEILKGTNSTDKAKGSRKFVERLVRSRSTGIIATHDLSLCEVAKKLPQVKNYYFDAEIVNNELHFDYHIKQGVCQNMNASFLLKKMGVVE
ncbi:DNA mismatch repair protein MutS [Flavobacteriaceae bacterium TP-CH-4]|uniref:DNA mismatch repair protein MutS n=1 Tax=Pelagihabitans pacificus TaxID=2696054 RepID=A0A967E9G8_9FLAO|nr:DNA mismatch repair protein MutS [Pelagihabitans pacificus]NHF58456.1 DNA mismatch repair protein MutS [Pelagihabitans pacificus]